jgi:hypothetical protein
MDDRYYTRSPRVDRGFRPEESYERRRPRSPSPGRRRVTTTEVVERRAPDFLEEDRIRRERENDRVLIRRSEVETRRRSPSPAAPRGILRRARSVSPTREEIDRIRREEIIHQHQTRSPRPRSRSPSMEARLRNRFDDRGRSMEEHERTETRIVERERRMARSPSSSRSPSPEPAPPVIRGPTIEREVVTHYRDVDHGVVQARPEPRFNHVNVSRHRSQSRERRAPRFSSEIDLLNSTYDELRITDTTVDDRHEHSVSHGHRRSHSAAPMSPQDREEAEYITSRIDSRGQPGEARHGITKDWNIIDVPPGTERVRMDGAGGAGIDVDWTQYSGVRRTQFVPDRDRHIHRDHDDEISIQRSSTSDISRVEREREVHIEKVTDRKVLRPGAAMPPPPRKPDMWTEITKDLVSRQAIEALNYEYEETDFHFYVMQYLQYVSAPQLLLVESATC